MSLYPTPTRMALLRDVADGEVWKRPDGRSLLPGPWRYRTVTAAIAALYEAGWVELIDHPTGARQWKLTDAGQAVLGDHARDYDEETWAEAAAVLGVPLHDYTPRETT